MKLILRLFEWVFPPRPLAGTTWRLHGSGDEVHILVVQSEDRYSHKKVPGTRTSSEEANWSVRRAYVKYRAPDGKTYRASYEEFRRTGRPIPTYIERAK